MNWPDGFGWTSISRSAHARNEFSRTLFFKTIINLRVSLGDAQSGRLTWKNKFATRNLFSYFKHGRAYATRRYPRIPSDSGTKRSEAVDESNRDHEKYENKGPPWYAGRKRTPYSCVSCQNVGVVSSNFLRSCKTARTFKNARVLRIKSYLPPAPVISRKLYESSPRRTGRGPLSATKFLSACSHTRLRDPQKPSHYSRARRHRP